MKTCAPKTIRINWIGNCARHLNWFEPHREICNVRSVHKYIAFSLQLVRESSKFIWGANQIWQDDTRLFKWNQRSREQCTPTNRFKKDVYVFSFQCLVADLGWIHNACCQTSLVSDNKESLHCQTPDVGERAQRTQSRFRHQTRRSRINRTRIICRIIQIYLS